MEGSDEEDSAEEEERGTPARPTGVEKEVCVMKLIKKRRGAGKTRPCLFVKIRREASRREQRREDAISVAARRLCQ